MPEFSPVAPRQMLPPPTTTATSVPNSCRASDTSMAMRSTMELSIVSTDEALANASPESLRTTRRHGCVGSVRSAPHDHLCEADDAGVAEHLLHRLLVVLGEGLLEQDPLLVPAVEHAVDDLGKGGLGLARVAGLGLERGPLGLDLIGGHIVPAEVLGLAEGDVDGDVVGQLLIAALHLDEHAVDATVVLDVEVGVDDVAGGILEAHDLAEVD